MEEFNIQGKQTSFYKYCPGTFGYTLVHMALFNFWIVYSTLFSKKNISQEMICPHSQVKGWQSMSNRKSSLIDREANEAYASGPLTCMGPFQGPGRGSSNALEMP